MPQLDNYIFISQINILILINIGYILFQYYILPLVMFYLKLEIKLVLRKLKCIYTVSSHTFEYKNLYDSNYKIINSLSIIYKFYNQYRKEYILITNNIF